MAERDLKDIEVKEVSLVDRSANKKKFLYYKRANKLLKSNKQIGDIKMDENIQKIIQAYFGEDKVDFAKAENSDVITKSLETINEYQNDFPDDLKKAVGVIVKQAGNEPKKIDEQDKDKDGKTDVEKAGAKFSKETLKKLQGLLASLKSILPALEGNVEKSVQSEAEKSVAELEKKIATLEKNSDDNAKDELTKTLAALNERLATVEKGTGVKKGIPGQDDTTDNSGKKWPSLSS